VNKGRVCVLITHGKTAAASRDKLEEENKKHHMSVGPTAKEDLWGQDKNKERRRNIVRLEAVVSFLQLLKSSERAFVLLLVLHFFLVIHLLFFFVAAVLLSLLFKTRKNPSGKNHCFFCFCFCFFFSFF
jgi:hypothetical protein